METKILGDGFQPVVWVLSAGMYFFFFFPSSIVLLLLVNSPCSTGNGIMLSSLQPLLSHLFLTQPFITSVILSCYFSQNPRIILSFPVPSHQTHPWVLSVLPVNHRVPLHLLCHLLCDPGWHSTSYWIYPFPSKYFFTQDQSEHCHPASGLATFQLKPSCGSFPFSKFNPSTLLWSSELCKRPASPMFLPLGHLGSVYGLAGLNYVLWKFTCWSSKTHNLRRGLWEGIRFRWGDEGELLRMVLVPF